jgi:hypothetical protein
MCIDNYSKLPTKFIRCDCAACITIEDPEMVHYFKVIDWDKYNEIKSKERIQENK